MSNQEEKRELVPAKEETSDRSIKAESSEFVEACVRPKLDEVLAKKLNLDEQYSERLTTLKEFGFLKEDKVKTPSFEEAMSTFKPEELEIASHFQKPTLLLVPENSFETKVKSLNGYNDGMMLDETYIDRNYFYSDSGSDQIVGWRVVIVDGANEMEAYEGDDLKAKLGERVESKKNSRKSGEKGMDRHRYVMLMMEAIRNNNPVDQKSHTILDDDPALTHCFVPFSGFDTGYHEVSFYQSHPNLVDSNMFLRSSVGGDVLIS